MKCQYTGVRDIQHLEVNWEYRKPGETLGRKIWTFDGSRNIDTPYKSIDKKKFQTGLTDVTKEHAIMLTHASLRDEGSYICKVEYYNDVKKYDEESASIHINILGM